MFKRRENKISFNAGMSLQEMVGYIYPRYRNVLMSLMASEVVFGSFILGAIKGIEDMGLLAAIGGGLFALASLVGHAGLAANIYVNRRTTAM